MANPLAKYGISDEELQEQINNSAEVDAGINEFMENEVVPYWRSVSPVHDGKYAASVRVIKKARNGKGKVGSTSRKAHLIELGTGADTKGKSPRYVPRVGAQVTSETPTPAFAPGEKTAAHFGGHLTNDGIEIK